MNDYDDIHDEDLRDSFDLDDKITVSFLLLALSAIALATVVFLWLAGIVTKGGI